MDNNFDEDEKTSFKDNSLLGMIICSNYSQRNFYEAIAEGFAYWLLTDENQRNKRWELWNKLFLDHLPNIGKNTFNFYNYQNFI